MSDAEQSAVPSHAARADVHWSAVDWRAVYREDSMRFSQPLSHYHCTEVVKASGMMLYSRIYDDVLLCGGFDGRVRVHQLNDVQTEVRSWKCHSGYLRCLQLDQPRNLLVTGGSDNNIFAFDWTTGQQLWELGCHSGDLNALHLVGNELLSCSDDQTIRVHDVRTQANTSTFHHDCMVYHCQFVGPLVLSGGTDHHVMVFDTRKDSEPILDIDTEGTVHRFNCIENKLFVGTGDVVAQYDLATGVRVRSSVALVDQVPVMGRAVSAVTQFGFDCNDRVICTGARNQLAVLDTETLTLQRVITHHTDGIYSVALNRRMVSTTSFDGRVLLYKFHESETSGVPELADSSHPSAPATSSTSSSSNSSICGDGDDEDADDDNDNDNKHANADDDGWETTSSSASVANDAGGAQSNSSSSSSSASSDSHSV